MTARRHDEVPTAQQWKRFALFNEGNGTMESDGVHNNGIVLALRI